MNEVKSELSSLSTFPALIIFICITMWEDGADKFKGNTGLKLTLVLALLGFTSVISAIQYSYLGLFWNNLNIDSLHYFDDPVIRKKNLRQNQVGARMYACRLQHCLRISTRVSQRCLSWPRRRAGWFAPWSQYLSLTPRGWAGSVGVLLFRSGLCWRCAQSSRQATGIARTLRISQSRDLNLLLSQEPLPTGCSFISNYPF